METFENFDLTNIGILNEIQNKNILNNKQLMDFVINTKINQNMNLHEGLYSDLLIVAIYYNNLNSVKHFLTKSSNLKFFIRIATLHGNLQVVEHLFNFHKLQFGVYDYSLATVALEYACLNGYLEIVQWAISNVNSLSYGNMNAMALAAGAGYLNIVKYLHNTGNYPNYCCKWIVLNAAESNKLNVLKWLNEYRNDIWTTDAIDLAAESGNYKVVKWLYKNRNEGFTRKAIIWANENEHFNIETYLIDKINNGKFHDIVNYDSHW